MDFQEARYCQVLLTSGKFVEHQYATGCSLQLLTYTSASLLVDAQDRSCACFTVTLPHPLHLSQDTWYVHIHTLKLFHHILRRRARPLLTKRSACVQCSMIRTSVGTTYAGDWQTGLYIQTQKHNRTFSCIQPCKLLLSEAAMMRETTAELQYMLLLPLLLAVDPPQT